MSGPLKPLTEAERAFAKAKHGQIRVCPPRSPDTNDSVVVNEEVYVSLKRVIELTGLAYVTVYKHATTGRWRMMKIQKRRAKLYVRLKDIF